MSHLSKNRHLKKNIKVLNFDKKEGHKIWKWLNELPKYKYHAKAYDEIEFTEDKCITNIVISDSIDTDDPWILVTNGNSKRAIKDYSYRFGGIESVFKNQKSNGFYLENTVNCSLNYLKSMYCFACIGVLYLTILKNQDVISILRLKLTLKFVALKSEQSRYLIQA